MDIIIGKKQLITVQTRNGKYKLLVEIVSRNLKDDNTVTFKLSMFQQTDEYNSFELGTIVNVTDSEDVERAILDKLRKECEDGFHMFVAN